MSNLKYSNNDYENFLRVSRKSLVRSLKNYTDSLDLSEENRKLFTYSLEPSGKLLRPLIVSAFEEGFSIDSKRLSNFKLALEMVHVSSLIHDDLPALDNDDIRRGRPSTHKKFGEGNALLGGDLMFAKAIEVLFPDNLILNHDSRLSSDPDIQLVRGVSSVHDISSIRDVNLHDSYKLISILVDAQIKLCEGQTLELNVKRLIPLDSNGAISSDDKFKVISILEDISLKKTGALFMAAAIAPFELSDRSISDLKSIVALMRSFSLAFQLKDDLLDSIHDSSNSIHIDEEINYVTLLGVDESKKYYQSLFQDTIIQVDLLGSKFNNLKSLFIQVLEIPEFI